MKRLAAHLRSDGPYLGLSIMYPAPGVIERIGADWDWIWVDGQHGQIGYQDTLALVRACELIARPAIVRVPSHDWGRIGQALDMGAAGIIVPLVNDVAQARRIVQAAKFPPVGERSYGGRRLIDRQGRGYAEMANHETLLIAQIETPEALRKADEIAAVDGIDALFYGGDDLMLRHGAKMTGARGKEEMAPELAIVANACRKHGKLAVNGSFSAEMLTLSQSYGYNLIVSGADSAFLATSSKQASEQARRTLSAAAAVNSDSKGAIPALASAY